MRKILATILVAILVAGVRYGLAAENRSLAAKRAGGGDVVASHEKSDQARSFKMSKPGFFSRGKMTKAMQLTSIDHQILEGCLYNLDAQNMSFPAGIANRDGCACSAKHITAQADPEHYSAILKHHAMLVSRKKLLGLATSEAARQQALEQNRLIDSAARKNSSLPVKTYDNLGQMVIDVDGTCSAPPSYRPQSLAKIAELRPLNWQMSTDQSADQPETVSVELRGSKETYQASNK